MQENKNSDFDKELPSENTADVSDTEKKKTGFKTLSYLFIKRAFDIVSATLLLLLLSWFILICIFVKWLEDFHSPVYISTRVGKDGKPA